MSHELAVAPISMDLQEKALLGGDLSRLSVGERLSYYNSVCESLGLNPLTRPFEYITLNGKLVLYARKDCTEQLRTNRCISVKILSREVVEGVYVVTAQASETVAHHQRTDESIGAVPIANLQGDMKANAMMKAETKAKRRVTLSICGLGMLDETELETIPQAKATVMDHKREAQAKLAELKRDAEAQPGAAGKEERARVQETILNPDTVAGEELAAAEDYESPAPHASTFDATTAINEAITLEEISQVLNEAVKVMSKQDLAVVQRAAAERKKQLKRR